MKRSSYQSCMRKELKGEKHRSEAAQRRAFGAASRRCARKR